MTPLLKGLQEKHEEPPMAILQSLVLGHTRLFEQSSDESSTTDPGPEPNQTQNQELAHKLLIAMRDKIDLPTLLTGGTGGTVLSPPMGYETTGTPLNVLILGAAISAVPGAEVASSMCRTAVLTTSKARSAIWTMPRLVKSLRGVNTKKPEPEENISSGWEDIPEQGVADMGCASV